MAKSIGKIEKVNQTANRLTRVSLWIMLYFCILCITFSSNNLNMAIVSMVKYSEAAVENTTGVCKNTQLMTSNITYGQKVNFPQANSQITFEWSKYDRNLVLGAFNSFPWMSPFLGGFLSHKYGTKLVTGWSTFVTCILSSLIPFAAPISATLVAGVRVIQGILSFLAVPSGIYPLAGVWYPAHERGKFFLVLSAYSIGNGLSFSIFGFLVDTFGWPYVFHGTSLCGLVWFLFWQYSMYDSPNKHPRISTKEKSYIQNAVSSTVAKEKLPVPWKAIITSVPFIINIICQIGATFIRYIFLVYLPTYFKLIHGLTPKEIGLANGLPYLLRAVCACIFAVIVDEMIQRKLLSKTGIRNIFTFISSVFSGLVLIGVAFAACNIHMAVTFTTTSIILSTGIIYGAGAGIVDMSPNFCGILNGIAHSISSTMGIFVPLVVTFSSNLYETDLLGQWKMVWLISALIHSLTGLIFILLSESEIQPWNAVDHEPSDKKLLR